MLKELVEEKRNFVEEHEDLTPRDKSRVWAIEEPLIDMYSLLVHRIEGIGLSLQDFWKMDTWILSKLYLTEIYLIEREEKQMKKGNTKDPTLENDEATEELALELFGED